MRVVCINKAGWTKTAYRDIVESYFFGLKTITRQEPYETPAIGPKYGEVLQVTETKNDIKSSTNEQELYYMFKEWDDNWYESNGFRPVDETEEQEATEKITELLKDIH